MSNPILERAVIDAAMNLAGATLSHEFTIPIPNTTPQLVVALFERGNIPVGEPHPCANGRCHLADNYRADRKCVQCVILGAAND